MIFRCIIYSSQLLSMVLVIANLPYNACIQILPMISIFILLLKFAMKYSIAIYTVLDSINYSLLRHLKTIIIYMAGKCMVIAIASDLQLSCHSCIPHSGKIIIIVMTTNLQNSYSAQYLKISFLHEENVYDHNFNVPLYMESASNFHGPAHDLPET